jgi:hypothetical protein
VWTASKQWAGGQTALGEAAMSGTELLVYRCVAMLGMLWLCVWGGSALARVAAVSLEVALESLRR